MRIDTRLLEPPVKKSGPLNEREMWDEYGCSNRQEWRDLLNLWMWKEYTSDIKDGCYIGTHESNLKRYRNKEEDE